MKKWRLLLLLLPLVAVALYMRSLASWRPNMVFADTGDVLQLEFSRDGKNLLIVNQAQWSGRQPRDTRATITVFDTQNTFGMQWQIKKDLLVDSTTRFFARDTKILLPGPDLPILDAQTGKMMDDYRFFPLDGVLSPDEKWLAYTLSSDKDGARPDGRVYLKSAPVNHLGASGSADKILGHEDSTSMCSFSPDGKTLVVGVGDWSSAHLDLYDVGSWKRVRTLTDRKVRSYHQSLLPKYRVMQWSPNGNYLMTHLVWDYDVDADNLWRIHDGKKFDVSPWLGWGSKLQNDGRVLGFNNTNHGCVLLSGSPGSNSKPTTVLQLPNDYVTAAALCPDGSYLVAGTQSGKVYRKRLK